jgi:ATP-binding cassette subfamily B protein
VPQSIFLSDISISQNIAFGLSSQEIDPVRLRRAAAQAQIETFIDTLPHGFSTLVGERGVRLSGGQRQRIGIARALYRETSFLVFDEATSALDANTEAEVTQALYQLSRDLTLVVIAHRTTTLKGCDRVIRVVDGNVIDVAVGV